MGNFHSRHIPTHSDSVKHPYKRKRSTVFSRISLGCVSVPATESSFQSQLHISTAPSQRPASFNEKATPLALDNTHPRSEVVYSPSLVRPESELDQTYQAFLKAFPEYKLTWIVDSLRRTDYSRLDQTGEAYVDYMGGALYPESLIRVHTEFLSRSIMGNTHSVSNSSRMSQVCANEARAAVLSYFHATPDYTVIFTSNASAALKLVGEAYPFTGGSSLVLGTDSHNSVHGIRLFSEARGGRTCYVPSTPQGGFDTSAAKNILLRNRPRSRELAPSLFVLTGQSNISNSKNPLSISRYAADLGYHVLLDAAALAPTSVISLSEHPVDAMAVSFYKMFGFPTGVGALIVKKDFLKQLKRPWFAGGTVDVVQVPGTIFTRAHELHEQFEDGTLNYLTLPAVTEGLRFLSAYLPFLPLRINSLLIYLVSSLSQLRHDTTGRPVVDILSRVPTQRLRFIGDQSETGGTVSLLFYGPSGELIPNSFIEHAAAKMCISLRTGCVCNPGGAAALLNIEDDMKKLYPGVTLKDFETRMGRELGVVRISLGLATNFEDVFRVVQFARTIGQERPRQDLWMQWMESQSAGIGEAF